MKKYVVLIIALVISGASLNAQSGDKDIDIDVIIQAAQRAYYSNNDYNKAMDILAKAAKYLQLSETPKYNEIIDVNWTQIKITLLEKGAATAQPLVENLMARIEAYHSKLQAGFSLDDNTNNLMLGENISKYFIYYPNGIQIIGSMLDSFIKIYKNDFSGEEHLRSFQSSRSYIYLLSGDLKSALNLSTAVMSKAGELEKCMYAINYGHALFFNNQGVEKAIAQYKLAFELDDELVSKSLLMDFQILRQFNFDMSGLKDYESQVKAKYLKNKYYKSPYITEIKINSQAEKVGLKAGDIIESYNNELVYDIEMFGIDRMSDRFEQNLKSREIKVLRNGQHLTFNVAPGLLGVYLDYKK